MQYFSANYDLSQWIKKRPRSLSMLSISLIQHTWMLLASRSPLFAQTLCVLRFLWSVIVDDADGLRKCQRNVCVATIRSRLLSAGFDIDSSFTIYRILDTHCRQLDRRQCYKISTKCIAIFIIQLVSQLLNARYSCNESQFSMIWGLACAERKDVVWCLLWHCYIQYILNAAIKLRVDSAEIRLHWNRFTRTRDVTCFIFGEIAQSVSSHDYTMKTWCASKIVILGWSRETYNALELAKSVRTQQSKTDEIANEMRCSSEYSLGFCSLNSHNNCFYSFIKNVWIQ